MIEFGIAGKSFTIDRVPQPEPMVLFGTIIRTKEL
jgi:hypothetical protein